MSRCSASADTRGRVGIIDQHCPHRGANLWLGRNEECGIRCVYHGWKFDVEGRGPRERMPKLPAMEVALVPASHRYVTKKWQDCNWVQAVEGSIDTAHFLFRPSGIRQGAR